jgi:hypothetical protein
MLRVLHELPAGFLDARPEQLHRLLDGPTLIHLQGARDPPLFVSVLLHGNEPAGLYGVQRVLRRRIGDLPRSLSLFVGNVAAAREGRRRLDGQPDYNRIWAPGSAPEHRMAGQVLHEMRARGAFVVVDVHNNTGQNPHYSIITRMNPRTLRLAARFDPRVIFAPYPRTVLADALHVIAPSCTLECGTPWDEAGYEHAAGFVEALLEAQDPPPDDPPPAERLELFESVAVVKVPRDVHFGFDDRADLVFRRDLDASNFVEQPAGTELAFVKPGSGAHMVVLDPRGEDVTDRFLKIKDDRVVTTTPTVPSMFSLDESVIRQDCLGYLLVKRSYEQLRNR